MVDYLEADDPYFESTEVVAAAAMAPVPRLSRIPSALRAPLCAGFPEGLSAGECLARGEGWLRTGEYSLASEAFRLAWLAHEDDAFAASQLGLALAAGGRWELSASCLAVAFSVDEALVQRGGELAAGFSSGEVFERDVLVPARKHLLRAPDESGVLFVLACGQLCAGDHWGAREALLKLKAAAFECTALQAMIDCCELQISGAPVR